MLQILSLDCDLRYIVVILCVLYSYRRQTRAGKGIHCISTG